MLRLNVAQLAWWNRTSSSPSGLRIAAPVIAFIIEHRPLLRRSGCYAGGKTNAIFFPADLVHHGNRYPWG